MRAAPSGTKEHFVSLIVHRRGNDFPRLFSFSAYKQVVPSIFRSRFFHSCVAINRLELLWGAKQGWLFTNYIPAATYLSLAGPDHIWRGATDRLYFNNFHKEHKMYHKNSQFEKIIFRAQLEYDQMMRESYLSVKRQKRGLNSILSFISMASFLTQSSNSDVIIPSIEQRSQTLLPPPFHVTQLITFTQDEIFLALIEPEINIDKAEFIEAQMSQYISNIRLLLENLGKTPLPDYIWSNEEKLSFVTSYFRSQDFFEVDIAHFAKGIRTHVLPDLYLATVTMSFPDFFHDLKNVTVIQWEPKTVLNETCVQTTNPVRVVAIALGKDDFRASDLSNLQITSIKNCISWKNSFMCDASRLTPYHKFPKEIRCRN